MKHSSPARTSLPLLALLLALPAPALAGGSGGPAGAMQVTVTVTPQAQPVVVGQPQPVVVGGTVQPVYVQPQPVYVQPQPVVVQPQPVYPPPPRPLQNQQGFWMSLRAGASIDIVTLNPSRLDANYSGSTASVLSPGIYGGVTAGWQTQLGFSFAASVGGRYHFETQRFGGVSSSDPNGFNYRIAVGEVTVLARYTALPLLSVHPFAEFAVGLYIPSWSLRTTTRDNSDVTLGARFGLGGTLGLEFDVTRNLSFEAGARLDYFLGSSGSTDPNSAHLLVTPLAGATWLF